MLTPNLSYANLKESYLFYHIAQKTKAYLAEHPDARLYRMGIGDVSLPLAPAVIAALHEAVDDQGDQRRFHGYMPECGAPFLREAIAQFYLKRNVCLSPDEVFVSSGASDELGDLLDLFDRSNRALIMEPATSHTGFTSRSPYGTFIIRFPSLRIFFAAFTSRLCFVPHFGQTHSLIDKSFVSTFL